MNEPITSHLPKPAVARSEGARPVRKASRDRKREPRRAFVSEDGPATSETDEEDSATPPGRRVDVLV